MDLDADPAFLHTFGKPGARGLRTNRALSRGEVVCRIPRTASSAEPHRHTVQIDAVTHVEVGVLATLNHSCDPNVRLDTDAMLVIAERDVVPGEELAYFYPSTEWDMAEPFECRCGTPQCLSVIRGARHLAPEFFGRYFMNRHILALREPLLNAGGDSVVEVA